MWFDGCLYEIHSWILCLKNPQFVHRPADFWCCILQGLHMLLGWKGQIYSNPWNRLACWYGDKKTLIVWKWIICSQRRRCLLEGLPCGDVGVLGSWLHVCGAKRFFSPSSTFHHPLPDNHCVILLRYEDSVWCWNKRDVIPFSFLT